jgi:hypothetical protein
MATNIPPHNLTEIMDGLLALIDNPSLTVHDLIKIIPGPDFPTAGAIHGTAGIQQAYHTGKGVIQIRAKADIEVKKNEMYINSIKKILTGDLEYAKFNKDSILAQDNPENSKADLNPSEDEKKLREQVALEDKYNLFEKAQSKVNLVLFPPVRGHITEKYSSVNKHFAVDIAVAPAAIRPTSTVYFYARVLVRATAPYTEPSASHDAMVSLDSSGQLRLIPYPTYPAGSVVYSASGSNVEILLGGLSYTVLP